MQLAPYSSILRRVIDLRAFGTSLGHVGGWFCDHKGSRPSVRLFVSLSLSRLYLSLSPSLQLTPPVRSAVAPQQSQRRRLGEFRAGPNLHLVASVKAGYSHRLPGPHPPDAVLLAALSRKVSLHRAL